MVQENREVHEDDRRAGEKDSPFAEDGPEGGGETASRHQDLDRVPSRVADHAAQQHRLGILRQCARQCGRSLPEHRDV